MVTVMGVRICSALMLDRLTVLFYLGPACLYVFTKVPWKERDVRNNILYSAPPIFGMHSCLLSKVLFATLVSYFRRHQLVRLIQPVHF